MSLLLDFIQTKIYTYVEPQRKGTPKGSAIGLTKVKYTATLTFLYGLKPKPMKTMAKSLKVSYGLLRKWSTEKQFKKQLRQNVQEFSQVFWDYIVESYNKHAAEMKAFLKKPAEQLASEGWPQMITNADLKPLEDFKEYSFVLQIVILAQTENILKNPDPVLAYYVSAILENLARRAGLPPSQELIAKEKEFRNRLEATILDRAIDTFGSANASSEERKEALCLLMMLRKDPRLPAKP